MTTPATASAAAGEREIKDYLFNSLAGAQNALEMLDELPALSRTLILRLTTQQLNTMRGDAATASRKALRDLHAEGRSWAEIGQLLGITGEAARQHGAR